MVILVAETLSEVVAGYGLVMAASIWFGFHLSLMQSPAILLNQSPQEHSSRTANGHPRVGATVIQFAVAGPTDEAGVASGGLEFASTARYGDECRACRVYKVGVGVASDS
ncbi:hypothetical protein RHS01_07713 [Rhizoctonia solani]|uniref:Uncharacterized protein n=1 Tax=Rhizoctonia solani TaxID=456999 RepID=A0A8H7I8Z8_9AGAM|nr:hypothetical protein RHS01_07713 [Rhizoctonia solani]